jgi:hypothetical protein
MRLPKSSRPQQGEAGKKMDGPDALADISEVMAEQITKTWASFNRSPIRAEIKERLQLAIATAIVKELIITNAMEMRGEGAKW